MDLYSAFIVVPHTEGAQVRITQVYLQITPYLPLPLKRSPDGASPDWGCGHLIAAYYSLVSTRKDDRLSRPGWLTYSGRFTHISGHPSAAGRAQYTESCRSKTNVLHVPRNQLISMCNFRTIGLQRGAKTMPLLWLLAFLESPYWFQWFSAATTEISKQSGT